MVKSATRKDHVLSHVYDVTMPGWPETAPGGLFTVDGMSCGELELWYRRSYGRSCWKNFTLGSCENEGAGPQLQYGGQESTTTLNS